MFMLYSVNLRVMGRANVSLLRSETLLSPLERMGGPGGVPVIVAFAVLFSIVGWLLWWLLHTELGLFIRASGENEQVVRTLGVNAGALTVVGVSLANGLVALSGAMVAQEQGFADATMGIGIVIIGLAAMVMGQTMLKPRTALRLVLSAVFGTIAYQLVIAVALRLGLAATDVRLATGVIVVTALAIPAIRHPRARKVSEALKLNLP